MLQSTNRCGLQIFAACLSLIVFAGCGDGRGVRVPVSGKVTIDGAPLAFGSVLFEPLEGGENNRPGGGALESDGTFRVSAYTAFDGLPPGSYRVAITGTEHISDTSQRWHAPKKYSQPGTSGLTAEIEEETDQLNFDLSWEGEETSEPFVEKGL